MKSLLTITGISLALTLPVQLLANSDRLPTTLNLTEQQSQQLKQFQQKRKLQLQQAKQAQQELDKKELSTFLSPEQVTIILEKQQLKQMMRKAKRNPVQKIILQAEQLGLSDNQIVQLEQLKQRIEQLRTDQVSRQEIRTQAKNELTVILSQEQIEKIRKKGKRLTKGN